MTSSTRQAQRWRSTYVGGTWFDAAAALSVDASGNLHRRLRTSTDIRPQRKHSTRPTTTAGTSSSRSSTPPAPRCRLRPSWGSDLRGGARHHRRRASSAYVTGRTFSAGYPTTAGAFDIGYDNSAGGADAFVTKLDSSGRGLSYRPSSADRAMTSARDRGRRRRSRLRHRHTEATNSRRSRRTDATYNDGTFDASSQSSRPPAGRFPLDLARRLERRPRVGIAAHATTEGVRRRRTNSSAFPSTAEPSTPATTAASMPS